MPEQALVMGGAQQKRISGRGGGLFPSAADDGCRGNGGRLRLRPSAGGNQQGDDPIIRSPLQHLGGGGPPASKGPAAGQRSHDPCPTQAAGLTAGHIRDPDLGTARQMRQEGDLSSVSGPCHIGDKGAFRHRHAPALSGAQGKDLEPVGPVGGETPLPINIRAQLQHAKPVGPLAHQLEAGKFSRHRNHEVLSIRSQRVQNIEVRIGIKDALDFCRGQQVALGEFG